MRKFHQGHEETRAPTVHEGRFHTDGVAGPAGDVRRREVTQNPVDVASVWCLNSSMAPPPGPPHPPLLSVAPPPPAPPLLSVAPTRALVDEELKVTVENLPPASPVTLHALHRSEDHDLWEAFGHYISDHRGGVSVADDLSFGGSFTGREPMGLLWSLRPVAGSRKGLRLRKKDVCCPLLVTVSLFGGHVSEGLVDRRPLVSVLIERWYLAPQVQRIHIREKGVRGTLFMPPGPGPFPGVLDLWGGGGGLVEYRSALLASHGYASLALQYLTPGELPVDQVELSYFETAFGLLRDHPQVESSRLGLVGLSLGSILALCLAAESSVKPACCVCISGGNFYAHQGVLGGMGDGFLRFSHMKHLDQNNQQIWRDVGRAMMADPANRLDVRSISCPLLLINGADDQNWPTVENAADMEQMMTSAGKQHLLTSVSYAGAGHLIEPPFSPHFRATNFMDATKQKVLLLWGGETKRHSDAQQDSWRRILAFLQHQLFSSPAPKARM